MSKACSMWLEFVLLLRLETVSCRWSWWCLWWVWSGLKHHCNAIDFLFFFESFACNYIFVYIYNICVCTDDESTDLMWLWCNLKYKIDYLDRYRLDMHGGKIDKKIVYIKLVESVLCHITMIMMMRIMYSLNRLPFHDQQ